MEAHTTIAKALICILTLCLGVTSGFVLPPSATLSWTKTHFVTFRYAATPPEKYFDVFGEIGDGQEPKIPMRGRKRRLLKKTVMRVFDSVGIEGNEDLESMTDEERAAQVFDRIDSDGDGQLNADELRRFGLNIEEMNSINSNRDNSIDKDEFESAIKSLEGKLASMTARTTEQAMADEIDETLGDLEPLERQELRLGGFEPYILVSVLTAQASFEELNDVDVHWKDFLDITSLKEFWYADWYSIGLLLSAGLSTMAGLYATVVFSLTILYGKTALGMDRDDEYYGFMDRTGLQRFRAFQAFSFGLFLFSVSVLLEFCLKCPELLRLPCVIASCTSLFYAKSEYDIIMTAAAPMFAPKAPPVQASVEKVASDDTKDTE